MRREPASIRVHLGFMEKNAIYPALMVTMDKTACCYAAVAAVLSVTMSLESARVPPAGLAPTANTVSQMRVGSTGHTVSPGDLTANNRGWRDVLQFYIAMIKTVFLRQHVLGKWCKPEIFRMPKKKLQSGPREEQPFDFEKMKPSYVAQAEQEL
ncbi:hypothetical protein llap_18897 [Limosa lapponica baueri]|uniref:Uncharacterized protein n=1 Tax=Limosa lapponica baueri TaxID=1758121 RepID=A0A2I0TAH3_LIMLA|nr:hypothetical protein llap_18897 [Limosa lapponica baueri]